MTSVTATTLRVARTASALVLTGVLIGSLAACSSSTLGAADCVPVVPTGDAAGYVTASGAFGTAPEVDFPTPLTSDGMQQAVIDAGEGEPIGAGQIVDFQVSLFNGQDGELITASSYCADEAPLGRTAGSDIDLLEEGLE